VCPLVNGFSQSRCYLKTKHLFLWEGNSLFYGPPLPMVSFLFRGIAAMFPTTLGSKNSETFCLIRNANALLLLPMTAFGGQMRSFHNRL